MRFEQGEFQNKAFHVGNFFLHLHMLFIIKNDFRIKYFEF